MINERLRDEPYPRREYLSFIEFFEVIAKQKEIYLLIQHADTDFLLSPSREYYMQMFESNLRDKRYSSGLDLPPDFMAAFISGAMLNVLRWWMEQAQNYTPQQMADMFFTIAFREPPPKT
jgi:hypothetical protein